jgi:hypothetical protein
MSPKKPVKKVLKSKPVVKKAVKPRKKVTPKKEVVKEKGATIAEKSNYLIGVIDALCAMLPPSELRDGIQDACRDHICDLRGGR